MYCEEHLHPKPWQNRKTALTLIRLRKCPQAPFVMVFLILEICICLPKENEDENSQVSKDTNTLSVTASSFLLLTNAPCFDRTDFPTTKNVFRTDFGFKYFLHLCIYPCAASKKWKNIRKTMFSAIYGQIFKSAGYKTIFCKGQISGFNTVKWYLIWFGVKTMQHWSM